jgi:hypothetical protein
MAAAKAHEAATHATADSHEAPKSHESAASAAASEASQRLLQDAQVFSGVVNQFEAPDPNGPFTQITRASSMAETINTKLNQVNELSPADRKTWLADLNTANRDTSLQQSMSNMDYPLSIDVKTGADGKATSFQITSSNFDSPIATTSSATLDATVGATGAQDAHFDTNKTASQFARNETVGMGHIAETGIKPADMAEYAAEVQAMPPNLRQQMIQDGSKILPTVKMNTDAQGNLQSVDFPGGHMIAADWTAANQSKAKSLVPSYSKDFAGTVKRYDAQGAISTAGANGGQDFYAPSLSNRSGDANSGARDAVPPSGTVVEGVGADSGTYIMNSDGTATRWGG